MEDEHNNRRLVVAAGLCLLVLMVWPILFPKPKQKLAAGEDGGTKTSTAAVVAEAPPTTDTSTVVVKASPTRPSVAREDFTFRGVVDVDGMEVPFKAEITNAGGGIDQFVLESYFERDHENRATTDPIGLADSIDGIRDDSEAAYRQMASVAFLEGTTFSVPALPVYEVVDADPDAGRVKYRFRTDDGVVIEREYAFRKDSFEVQMAVTIRNESNREHTHRLQVGSALKASDAMVQGGGFFSRFIPPPDHLQGLCFTDSEVERFDVKSLADEKEAFSESVRWVAMDRQYFLAAIIARDGMDHSCKLGAKERRARAGLVAEKVTLAPGRETRHKFTAYLGVKKQSLLTQVDAKLEGAVDYKIFGLNLAPLCSLLLWILALIHGWTGSWGVAIIGLTVLVKLVLFPLNQRSGKSMRAMAALKPQMEEIKKKFPEDRQRQSEEQMKLFREHNVNPAGGCLPMLIQMPIWFALYRSLWVSVDLYQQGFLWIPDLTTRDPFWILPVTLVVVMFLQQKLTPSTMDPMQQKIMMYTMPLVFGGMMSALPAGLCFYIVVNTLLTIVQMQLINKSMGPIGSPAPAQESKA